MAMILRKIVLVAALLLVASSVATYAGDEAKDNAVTVQGDLTLEYNDADNAEKITGASIEVGDLVYQIKIDEAIAAKLKVFDGKVVKATGILTKKKAAVEGEAEELILAITEIAEVKAAE